MADEDILEFQDVNPLEQYLQKMWRMKKPSKFRDTMLRTEYARIRAYSTLLRQIIPYFASVRRNADAEIADVPGVDPVALKSVINLSCGKELNITMANVKSLLDISLQLRFDKTRDHCLEFLYKEITLENALTIRRWCDFENNDDIIENIDRFIRANFEDICRSEDFLNISFAVLKDFVSRDDLNVLWEEDVYECVIRWVKKSESKRSVHLPELLNYVRLHLLSREYLANTVAFEKLILKSSACKVLLLKTAEWLWCPRQFPDGFCFNLGERFCRENHHLKCARRKGFGTYAVCQEQLHGTCGVVIKYYDHINDMWTTLFSINKSLYSGLLCAEGEKVYFTSDREVCVFDLREKILSLIDIDMPSHCGEVLHQNKIYFFGTDMMDTKTVRCLDLENLLYTKVGQMIRDRVDSSLVSLGSEIYLIGGYHPDNSILNSVEKYNPVTNVARKVAPMLIPRFAHFSTTVDGKIYTCGGLTPGIESSSLPYTPTNMCEVYDPANDQWRYIGGNDKFSRIPTSLFSFNKELHVLGRCGEFSEKTHYSVESYNASEGDWEWKGYLRLPGSCDFATILLTK